MGQSDVPKVLVMFKQKPLILHLLHELEAVNQLAKPLIVVGFKHKQVQDILGDGYSYALQPHQLGTGHAVMSAEPSITAENILVLYGDMPFIRAGSLKRLIELHLTKNATMSMFTAAAPNFEREYESLKGFGRIIRDGFGNIVKITEYKDADEKERNIREVNPGIYMFNTKWLFSNIHSIQNKNANGEYYLTDMAEIAMSQNIPIHSLSIKPHEVLGINTIEQMQIAASL